MLANKTRTLSEAQNGSRQWRRAPLQCHSVFSTHFGTDLEWFRREGQKLRHGLGPEGTTQSAAPGETWETTSFERASVSKNFFFF